MQENVERQRLYDHIFGTYISLRRGMAIIGFLLPAIVVAWGFLFGVGLQPSLSAYYWAQPSAPISSPEWSIFLDPAAPSRVWFVGLIFALAVSLYLYKGFSQAENTALNLAGLLAVGVAVFPMCKPDAASCGSFSLHGFSAIGMFACLAYVVFFCAKDTLQHLPADAKPGREQYRKIYNGIGLGMVAAPVAAFVVNAIFGTNSYVLWIEGAAIWVFATYWAVKSRELGQSRATDRALAKEISCRHGPDPVAKALNSVRTLIRQP